QGSQTTYIDDFRIHPVEANMVSFVYDPDKQLLQAKLDENNFAMIYIYDEYGKLVQTKRETEKGIYTIKTTKQNLSRIEH
ncbi:MAG: hypothetical protein NTZ89_00690, partial [Actinobacteria bacterium]|nr:hypothetical protein [Actinomycetota bacterium]